MILVVLASLIFLIQAGFLFWVEYKDRSLFFLIWPALTIFTVVPIFREYVLYADVHLERTILTAIVLAIAFNFSYLISYIYFRRMSPAILEKVPIHQKTYIIKDPLVLSAVLFICSILVFYIGGFSAASVLESTWRDKGDLGLLALVILYIVSVLSGLLCRAAFEKRFIVALLIAAMISLIVIIFRTRGLIAMSVISFAIYLIYVKKYSVLWIVPIATILIGLSVILRAARFMGSLSNVTWEGVLYNSKHAVNGIFDNGDLSVYKIYLQIVRNCDRTIPCFDYTYITSLGRIVGMDEGQRFEYTLYDNLIGSGEGGSLHPTAYGIAFGDLGIIGGVLLFAALPLLHLMINRYTHQGRFFLMIGFIAPYIIFLPRGSIYNSLSLMVVGVLVSFLFGGRRSAGEAIDRETRRARSA